MIFNFFALFLLLLSCSTDSPTKNKLPIINRDGMTLELPEVLRQGSKLPFQNANQTGSIFLLKFNTSKEAKEYAMERRLLILRKFETLIEPYFGTVNAKNCSENVKSDHLKIEANSLSAVMQVPTLGPDHLIHDCLAENNSDWANIEFLVCGKDFYDIRTYVPLSAEKPPYQQNFRCHRP